MSQHRSKAWAEMKKKKSQKKLWVISNINQQSSRKSVRVYRYESYKMIKMYLKIQDIFTRPNEFLPDMSGRLNQTNKGSGQYETVKRALMRTITYRWMDQRTNRWKDEQTDITQEPNNSQHVLCILDITIHLSKPHPKCHSKVP